MAEESQNLVENQIPEETVVQLGNREPRTMSCNKGSLVTALSVFVSLLVVSQAVMVYFMTQQHYTINSLGETTKQLKVQDMIKKLPGSFPSQGRQRMRMGTINIPLAFRVADGSPDTNMNDLEKLAETSNKMEDAAKYILLKGNPLRTYSSFNGSTLTNLRELKKKLTDQEWMVFDSWMQQWYLFFLVQNAKNPENSPPLAVTAAPVLTQCQVQARSQTLLGGFVPKCDQNGDYKSMQCWESTGFCWCVYKNGTEIPETKTRAKIDCKNLLQPEEPMLGSTPSSDYEYGL
ncbi:HLA class II histocompatibility antigen gamma chain [Rhinophrynus dorsalis]